MKENDCWGDFGYLWDVNDIPDGLGTEGDRLMEVKNYADELVEEDTLDDEYNFTDEDYEIDDKYEEYEYNAVESIQLYFTMQTKSLVIQIVITHEYSW